MLFYVRMNVNMPSDLAPETAKQLSTKEHERAAELQREGKWQHLWRVAGSRANVSIFEVESPAELHAALESLPFFPYMDVDVVALCPHPGALPKTDAPRS